MSKHQTPPLERKEGKKYQSICIGVYVIIMHGILSLITFKTQKRDDFMYQSPRKLFQVSYKAGTNQQ
jgi:hypothetical protein